MINNNNFPYGGGRELASDNIEMLKIHLNKPLAGFEPYRHARSDVSANRCEVQEEHRGRHEEHHGGHHEDITTVINR